jgi:hypothetical protein
MISSDWYDDVEELKNKFAHANKRNYQQNLNWPHQITELIGKISLFEGNRRYHKSALIPRIGIIEINPETIIFHQFL